jgi:aspartyl-tRNA(Asn)/glutamyl-tRNA(Gln) amidotransferase subunit A
VDVIACPTASVGGPSYEALTDANGHIDVGAFFSLIHTPYWDSLGNPVMALPMGFSAAGMPLSLQLAGPAFGEAAVVRAGDAFQQATDWHLRVPSTLGIGIASA